MNTSNVPLTLYIVDLCMSTFFAQFRCDLTLCDDFVMPMIFNCLVLRTWHNEDVRRTAEAKEKDMKFQRIYQVPADVDQVVPEPKGMFARTWEEKSRQVFHVDEVVTDAILDEFRKMYGTFPVMQCAVNKYDDHTVVLDAVYDNCN